MSAHQASRAVHPSRATRSTSAPNSRAHTIGYSRSSVGCSIRSGPWNARESATTNRWAPTNGSFQGVQCALVTARGWALFIALAVLWGIPYLFIKVAVDELSPAMVVWVRVALGALILLPIVVARGDMKRLSVTDWSWIVVFAFVEIALPFGALSYAEIRLSSSVTAILIAAVPILAAVIGWRIGIDDRISKSRALGLAIGVIGVVTLVGIDIRGDDWLSVAALGITIVGYSFGPIIVATKLSRAPAMAVITMALVVNAIVYAPLAWVTRPLVPVSTEAWWSVIILGVLCTAAAFLVFFALIAEAGPSRTTVITFIAPAVALALGVVILSEPLTWGILVGFPLVIIGSFLATRRAPAVEAEPHP
ncbi:MAG: EamA family transporter [Micrococcales bacterium]|nr:EamA family transporter [Micrococcales bacterium]